MKAQIAILSIFLLFGCKTRKVNKSEISLEQIKKEVIRDTIWKEKIVEKEIIKRDTFVKKVYDFGIQGKPTYDSITKTWKPFSFDYWIYNGNDSIRHKGSFSGEGSLNSGIDWEKRYNELLEKSKEKNTEAKSEKKEVVESTKFKEAQKQVQSEGWSVELAIYCLAGTALIFYLLGLFTPKIKNLIIKYLNPYFPMR